MTGTMTSCFLCFTYAVVISSTELQGGRQLALKLDDRHFLDLCPEWSRLGRGDWEIMPKGDFQAGLMLFWGSDLTSGCLKRRVPIYHCLIFQSVRLIKFSISDIVNTRKGYSLTATTFVLIRRQALISNIISRFCSKCFYRCFIAVTTASKLEESRQ